MSITRFLAIKFQFTLPRGERHDARPLLGT